MSDDKARIKRNVAKMQAAGASDAEIADYLRGEGLKVPAQDGGFRGTGSSGGWEETPKQTVGHGEGLVRQFNQGATFGFADEASAGIASTADAVGAALSGKNPLTAMRQGYGERVAGERQRDREYAEANPKKAFAAEMAGGAAPLLFSGGASAVTRAPSLGGKMVRGALVGGAAGAATGAGKAEGGIDDTLAAAGMGAGFGAAAGGLFPVAGEAAGWLGGKMRVGDGASAVTRFLASKAPQGSGVQRRLEVAGESMGRRGKAASELAERMEMDANAGHVAPEMHPDVPEIALDRAGPNVMGLAKNVVRTPGEGRTRLAGTVQERSAGMRGAVDEALERRTGHPAATGISELEAKLTARQQEAKQLYGAAVEATGGRAVQSPSLDAIMRTPTGADAFAWAKAQMGDRMQSLPRAAKAVGEAVDDGFERSDVENVLAPEVIETLPDPEVLHLMKRYLKQMAKVGARTPAEGKAAAEAQSALNLFNKVRTEFPPEWRKADDAYAAASRLIDVMNQGRNALRTRLNPTGTPQRAVRESLPAVEAKRAAMPAEEAAAHQTGAAHAVSSGWQSRGQSTQSPGRFFNASPERERQVALAFPDKPTADDFRRLITSWDEVQGRAQTLLGGSDTQGNVAEEAARRGTGASAVGELFQGNPGNAIKTLFGGVTKDADSAERREINRVIADYLASQPNALERAKAVARLRSALGGRADRLLPGIAGQQSSTLLNTP